jgi:hypothetical protein
VGRDDLAARVQADPIAAHDVVAAYQVVLDAGELLDDALAELGGHPRALVRHGDLHGGRPSGPVL